MNNTIKFGIINLLLIILPFTLFAQLEKHIEWDSRLAKKEAAIGESVELIFTAEIDKDWYLYSSDFDPDLGPMVTEFSFEENDTYELVGEVKPINPKRKYDSLIWEGEYTYFKEKAEFRQKVKVLKDGFNVKVGVLGQTCSDIDGKCILFEEVFNFSGLKVKNEAPAGSQGNTEPVIEKNKDIAIPKAGATENPVAEAESESSEQVKSENEVQENMPKTEVVKEEVEEDQEASASINDKLLKDESQGSLFWLMVLAFTSGLAAIVMPCVFPMIPMTVSFFTNRKAKGEAVFFGLSIIFIYTVPVAIMTKLFGLTILNELSTNWFVNLLFFAIFIIFAFSFFGAYELVLPSKWITSADKQVDKGGLIAPFFMALTLSLVSFSCTGPIIALLLGLLIDSNGETSLMVPILGIFVFSLSFALPFTIFAFFPRMMDKLPKSGGWMNTIKVTFGFIELALAFKFLSVADQVYHWGILDREVYIAIWAAISLFMGLYYLGYIRLPHDEKQDHVSVSKLLLSLVCFAFLIYLIPGMFGAPLKGLSGYLPPRNTHDFDIMAEIQQNKQYLAYQNAEGENRYNRKNVKYAQYMKEMPHGIQGYYDFEQGMKVAKEEGKPVFIDFTGHGCVNCRKMEDNVWGETPVLSRLMNDYIVIALYVDDRTVVPEEDWVKSEDGKIRKTIGAINAHFQIERFNRNAQPFYVLLDHNENLLVKPIAYEPDVNAFVTFLDRGLDEFNKRDQKLVKK
ncbi:protein-disulfide reductase DsbD family protein [Flexithrix dorotheae]|uniref:protein-disulfide reductase DsbD family protein n=1 Tax=Flexithrix dorotheae TaxID=70993 RepID=UPI0003760DB1|nr:cytochrome c biogenesis protein CcdA [Flexithrix dorotheae]